LAVGDVGEDLVGEFGAETTPTEMFSPSEKISFSNYTFDLQSISTVYQQNTHLDLHFLSQPHYKEWALTCSCLSSFVAVAAVHLSEWEWVPDSFANKCRSPSSPGGQ
jgi:hypothetical protein